MKRLLYKSFIMLILVIFSFTPIVFFNYAVDPYGIFGDSYENRNLEPNQRFVKVQYIINNPNKYDAYLFGSSRVGVIPTEDIEEEKVYNMTYSEGVPEEHLYDIQLFLENGVKNNKVILGLDNISYLVDSELHENQLLRKKFNPDFISKMGLYWHYLTNIPSTNIITELKKEKKFPITFDIDNSGRPVINNIDAWIEANKTKHINKKVFETPDWFGYYYPRVEQVIEEISAIQKLAEKNNFKLVVFINPMHAKTYLRQDFEIYSEFLRELSKITDYYDFSGINEITTNNYYYYETSHYRPIVGEMILEKLYPLAEKKHNKHEFGFFVTNENIEERITVLESQIELYKSKE